MKTRPGLVQITQTWGRTMRHLQTETRWVFEGTESMPTFPRATPSEHPVWGTWISLRGIYEYGTVRVKGHEDFIAYRAAIPDLPRLASLGWREIGRNAVYVYVTRGDRRLQAAETP